VLGLFLEMVNGARHHRARTASADSPNIQYGAYMRGALLKDIFYEEFYIIFL